MSAPWPSRGVSTITSLPAARTRRDRLGIDLAGAEVGVPVGAGVERVAAVVGVHEIDAAGDGEDALDDAGQLLAAGMGVAGVEAEPGPELADRVPEPREPVEPAGHRVVAARGVLDQDRQRKPPVVARPGERLTPVVEADRRVVRRR